jgi:hypothetical protein
MNSEVCKVRAQELGAPSHEVPRAEARVDTWQIHKVGLA